MTSKEIVKRAIHFENPPRIPYNYDSNRTPVTGKNYGDDFIWCFLDPAPGFNGKNADGDRVDEWGNVWKNMGETFGEPICFAYKGLETYAHKPLPDFLNPLRYQSMRQTAEENNGEKYLLGMLPHGIFQVMIELFGFEDFMLQIAGNTDEFQAFASKLCGDCIAIIRKMAECGMDGVILIEDMGLQDRMMISPQMWRDIYVPLYTRMFAAAHECGLEVFSHTCGYILDILDLYVQCGLDVIQLDQQDNMGLETLSERFRGKVCFFCPLDIQTTVNFSRKEIFDRCGQMVRLLSTEKGGFMAKTYPQPDALHITHEYMQNLADGFAMASFCRCTAPIPEDVSVQFAPQKLVLKVGETVRIRPADTVYQDIVWKTDDVNGNVIEIEDSFLKAAGAGKANAVIIPDAHSKAAYAFSVEVLEQKKRQEFQLALNYEEVRLDLHSLYDLPLYVRAGYYTEPSDSGIISWKSLHPSVAAVDDCGRVRPVSAGEATIAAVHEDFPENPLFCKVTVYENCGCGKFYYVSPSGSDHNPGTEREPFRTVQKARDTIRTLNSLPDGGVTVILEDGEYPQDEPILFTPQDSGTEKAPIVYRARRSGKAVITGGKAITGWKKAGHVEGLAPAAQGKVYAADVEKGWRFHDLYVNGERQQNSRCHNTDAWRSWPAFYGRVQTERCSAEKGLCVEFEEGELDGLEGSTDAEIILLPTQYWNIIAELRDIDSAGKTAFLRSKIPAFVRKYDFNRDAMGGTGEGWYNILNTLKYLDEPGEWCIDSKAGKVYYWPKNEGAIHQDKIVAPKPYELIRLQGDGVENGFQRLVEYLTFDGIAFQYTDRISEDQIPEGRLVRNAENPDAAVYFDGTAHCRLINSSISHSGSFAVTVSHYAQHNEILHNQLKDLGSGGVQFLGYGVGTVDVNHHNIVQYNSVGGMGRAPYQHAPGFGIFGSGENTIAYNHIVGAPYAGISIVGTYFKDVDPANPNQFACPDAYGNSAHQYNIRFEDFADLPDDAFDGDGCCFSVGTLAEKYQHSGNNVIEYNILDDYSQSMDDGGGLYSWCAGMGNTFAYNVLKEQLQGARTWIFRLYMDDNAVGATLEKNLCTGCFSETIDKSQLHPPFFNRWGLGEKDSNMTAAYPEKPGGYDELRRKILDVVGRFAGGFFSCEGE